MNCAQLHHRHLRRVCFPRSEHLPGPGSQRVRGSNPLSSTPTSWFLISVFLLVTGGRVADGRLLLYALTTRIRVDCGRIVIARRRP